MDQSRVPSADAEQSIPRAEVSRTVLVVDDSRVQRRILSASLGRWGYCVLEAGSAAEALVLCGQHAIDIVLSDWMMPGMDGLEFCQVLRAIELDRYVYFILLTSKSEKEEIARGLDVGADDFLTKPVNAGELRARIAAGERILEMERELVEKNTLLGETLAQLQQLYAAVDRDLVEARKLQQSLVPDRARQFGSAEVNLVLHPSGHLGGDLCGQFRVDDSRIGLFSIDVSGHGIASALMTARIAGHLTGASPEHNVALMVDASGRCRMRPPAEVCAILNAILLGEMETDHYLTMVVAEVDLGTGAIEMAQAGHPNPVLMRADGRLEFLGTGGLPIGLLPEASWEGFSVQLEPGDRLMLYSDGITECTAPDGSQLEDEGLARLLRNNAALSGADLLGAIEAELQAFTGSDEFSDDVSGVLLTFHGNGSH